jgi:ribonuclease HII
MTILKNYLIAMAKTKKILEDFGDYDYVAGLDEVGRGCGAGPVVTAAVIMPKGFKSELIRDSKQLTEKQRNDAYKLILENALDVVCMASTIQDINDMGINPATFKTMHRCLDGLKIEPEQILVDGTVWQKWSKDIPVTLVPKGDDTYTCIAAAAIVAKVRRDEYMTKLHKLYPNYLWDGNKGYLSPQHIAAIKEHGICKYHRNQYVRNFL